jgi:hypothetical protein
MDAITVCFERLDAFLFLLMTMGDRRESHTFIQGNRSLISFKHGIKPDATK